MDSGATNFMIFAVLVIVLLFIYVFSNRAASTNNQITEPPKDVSGEFNPVSVKKDGNDLGNVIGDLYNDAGSSAGAKDDVDGKSSNNTGDSNDSSGSANADEPRRRGGKKNGSYGSGGGDGSNDADGSSGADGSTDADRPRRAGRRDRSDESTDIATSQYRGKSYQTTPTSFPGSTTFQPYGFVRSAPARSNSLTPSQSKNGYYRTTPTPTSLTSYSTASRATTTSNFNLSTTLSPYKYLGDISVSELIESGDDRAKFKASVFPLTIGLYIKAEDDYYKIITIENATNNKGKSTFVVNFDKPINIDVDADEMLSVYFTTANEDAATPSGFATTPSRFVTTPSSFFTTPFGEFTTTPVALTQKATSASDSKNTYLLHLTQGSKINSSLVFKPYSDVTDSELKVISSLIVHTPENFGEETTEAPIDPSLDATLPPLDMSDPSLDATLPPLDMSDPSIDATLPPLDMSDPSLDVTLPSFDTTSPSFDTTAPSLDASVETTYSSYETTYPSIDTTEEPEEDVDTSSVAATMSSFATTMSSLITTYPSFTTTSRPDFNSCGSASKEIEDVPVKTSAPARNKKLSVLYITDCVSYPIYTSVYRNGSLIIQLKTDDDRTINAGYYKLVI